MSTKAERDEASTARLEASAAGQATKALRAELAAAALAVVAQAAVPNPAKLRKVIRDVLGTIVPSARVHVLDAGEAGRALGHAQEKRPGVTRMPDSLTFGDMTDDVGAESDSRSRSHIVKAIELAAVLPMDDMADTMAVLAKANASVRSVETDVAWAVHRGVALGKADVAYDQDMNLVWVAERNACPHCLAYQGHVAAPGREFPLGLTYGDRPVKPLGKLLGPPLHPHCRCQLELTDLKAGSLDVDLAREAARSVARGLSDYSSEVGKRRAVDRLLKGKAGVPLVKLPKSVLERAARDLAAGKFTPRPR